MMIQIKEPKSPWEIVHMEWATALPPGGDRSYNACLVLVDRYSQTTMFLPSYHPQTDGLEERMIDTLEDMIRRFFPYGLEFKESDGFTHYWCTLKPALELAYETSIHSSTGKTAEMLKKDGSQDFHMKLLKRTELI
ncbi:hypothetical protein O181_088855 [Austropuccinia psidii MF-1]|uniref:Integrase catalytic domain-containing protein n=1 Tax=Austropuccinia psidii MF-1 TaxID=1389203 RepID=A0A9Q3P4Q7_9BASI|nr:hypothetical protein [Austropuccinia psidii MF-1]